MIRATPCTLTGANLNPEPSGNALASPSIFVRFRQQQRLGRRSCAVARVGSATARAGSFALVHPLHLPPPPTPPCTRSSSMSVGAPTKAADVARVARAPPQVRAPASFIVTLRAPPRACGHACVHACVRAYVRACVRAPFVRPSVRACVRACVRRKSDARFPRLSPCLLPSVFIYVLSVCLSTSASLCSLSRSPCTTLVGTRGVSRVSYRLVCASYRALGAPGKHQAVPHIHSHNTHAHAHTRTRAHTHTCTRTHTHAQ